MAGMSLRRLFVASMRPCVVSAALGVAAWSGTPRTAAQNVFRSTVDLVAIDVQVVEARGDPIPNLSKADFDVSIDGKRRPVVSAELIQVTDSPPPDLGTVPAAVTGFNDVAAGTPAGRTYMIVIDAGSLIGAEAAPVADVVRAFINSLPPADRIGLLILPMQAPQVDPTTDREIVRRALARMAAVGQQLGGEFHLSESEIVDIMADASALLSSGRGRAMSNPGSLGSEALQRVQARECRIPGELRCVEAIVGEAAAFGHYFEQRATAMLVGLKRMLDGLRMQPGRKTVIVLSAGVAVSDRSGGRLSVVEESRNVGTLAAYAHATIYSLHLDVAFLRSYSPETRRQRDVTSFSRDHAIAGRLLEQIAAASGGTRLQAQTDGGQRALERVLRETSAYYLLGVEPDPNTRDGRPHRLGAKVSQRDATVRHRQWVVLPRAGN